MNDDPPRSPTAVSRLLGRLFGDRAERAAASYLKRLGYRVLTRGYRIREGEVDLIAIDGRTIVFVEVKARRGGSPAEAVTPEKQRKLTLAALHFLKRHRAARPLVSVRRAGDRLARRLEKTDDHALSERFPGPSDGASCTAEAASCYPLRAGLRRVVRQDGEVWRTWEKVTKTKILKTIAMIGIHGSFGILVALKSGRNPR